MTYYKPTKPPGTLLLKSGSYVRLDTPPVIPVKEGIIHHLVYLNVTYTLRDPKVAGELTIRLVRRPFGSEPEDPTSYQTYPLVPTVDGRGSILVTHTYFETTEKGRPVDWGVKIEGATGKVGTRYRKGWQP